MVDTPLSADAQSAANAAVEAGKDPAASVAAAAAVDAPVADKSVASGDTPADAGGKSAETIAAEKAATEKAAANKAAGDDGKTGQKADDAKGDDAKTGAPETYEEFTLPEGMEVNPAALQEFDLVAKDLDLSQKQAQKLVDIQTQHERVATEQRQTAWEDVLTEWREAAKSDTRIGGSNLQKTLTDTSRFLDKFASPELRKLLDTTGVGNNVEFLRLFAAAGNAMGEDSLTSGRPAAAATTKTQAEILYPNTPSA